jgi:hypothetical protein
MSPTPEQELRQAIEQWLAARETFHGEGNNGIGTLDGFWEAHRRLLAAFTAGWEGDIQSCSMMRTTISYANLCTTTSVPR